MLTAAVVVAGWAASARAQDVIDGYWMDSHGEVILKAVPCGAEFCAKVAWLKQPNGPDGLPLRDYRNSDEGLRARPVCGMTVVTGFKKQPDGTWGDGTVYVPDIGSSFSGYAEVLGPTQIKVTGYVWLPIFGQSEVWSRVGHKFQVCWDKKDEKKKAPTEASAKPGAPPLQPSAQTPVAGTATAKGD